MGHSASKSGVVMWGPAECEDIGWEGSAPRTTGGPSVISATAGAPPSVSGAAPSLLQLRLVEGLKAAAVRAVAAGSKHFACLAQAGEIYMWGSGAQGQLGLGNCADVASPKILRPVASKAVQAVSCGSQHTACVLQDGSAYTWGCAVHGRLGLGALKLPRGAALLGEGGSDLAQQVVPAPQHVRSLEREHVTQVSCGAFHTAFLVVADAGTSVYTCGLGLSGRLGHGDEEDRHVPEKVQELEGLTVTQVACGGHHTACITSAGCLYTWGGAAFGKLGLDVRFSVRKPTKVEGPLGGKVVASVALGTQHSACTTADGELYTWGQGRRAISACLLCAQLGHEENGEADEPLPRQVQSLAGRFVTSVACGDSHTVCLVEGGELILLTWASSFSCAVGHGDPSCAPNSPTPLRALRGKGVSHIACGGTRSVALCDAGHVASKGSVQGDRYAAEGLPGGGLPTAAQAASMRNAQGLTNSGKGAGQRAASASFTATVGMQDISDKLAMPSQGSLAARTIASHIGGRLCDRQASADMQIAHLSRELQAARMDSLLLAALLKGAATELDAALHRIAQLEAEVQLLDKSSADAGDRLATLRGHYEQHIKELRQQLAQQDVQFHAALAARSCSSGNTGSHGVGGAAAAAIVQRLSLEEALADPLGSQGPSLFALLPRECGSSPASDGAGSSQTPLDKSHSPSAHSKGDVKLSQALLLRSRNIEPFTLPLASASAPTVKSTVTRHQQHVAEQPRNGENQPHISEGAAAPRDATSTPAIPVFVLEENENPWL
ncbi:hypothetical protein Efla_007609 [Eimeria flavescens]